MPGRERALRHVALAAYLSLFALVLGWEAWGAPQTPLPRAFWIGLKGFPLLLPLPWLWHGGTRAHLLAALVVLLYFCEGVAATYGAVKTNAVRELGYGLMETALSGLFVAAAIFHARITLHRAGAETGS